LLQTQDFLISVQVKLGEKGMLIKE